ncbi:MAG: YyaL domain-containing protein, partial [Solirubrobacteraceae bacterium]
GGGAEPGQPPARGETSLAGAEAPALVAERLLDAASRCADFVLTRMRDAEGRLLRTFDGGEAKLLAYLEDHGFLLEALLSLYEASGQERWLSAARELAAETIDRFADQERGGFFSTAIDGEALLTRRKDIDDSPIPSGASSVALALLRLHALTGEREYERHATETLALVQELAPRHPSAFGHALQAMRLLATPPLEIAIVGPNGPARDALERAVRSRLLPNAVLAVGDGASKTSVPLLEGRVALDGAPAAYVCRNFACERPVSAPGELRQLLDVASGHRQERVNETPSG